MWVSISTLTCQAHNICLLSHSNVSVIVMLSNYTAVLKKQSRCNVIVHVAFLLTFTHFRPWICRSVGRSFGSDRHHHNHHNTITHSICPSTQHQATTLQGNTVHWCRSWGSGVDGDGWQIDDNLFCNMNYACIRVVPNSIPFANTQTQTKNWV